MHALLFSQGCILNLFKYFYSIKLGALRFKTTAESCLNEHRMHTVIAKVLTAVYHWKEVANKIGIANKEIQRMQSAFNIGF